MGVIVVGLNHKTAALNVREQLAFGASEVPIALGRLKDRHPQSEFVLLSTCNRVEIYAAGEETPERMADALIVFLSDFRGIAPRQFAPFVYRHENEEAVRHLLRVAAGLDSMVIGEVQILGQVKDSYKQACAAKSTGKILNRLFHCAFFTAKSVHTLTGISNGRVSVAGVAVELAMQLFADLARARVVVIGAGEMGALVVQHLLKAGCTNITVVNRSHGRGLDLGRRCQIAVKRWEELGTQIGQAHIVISSATTQGCLYSRTSFEATVRGRKGGTLLIIDIGVPRNFEPAINQIEGVYLYSVDELQEVAEQNLKARQADIAGGLEIVYAQAADFMEWFYAKDIGPLIGRMKAEFRQVGRNEIERFFVGPRHEASCRDTMEAMVNRVVNKLLHCVIRNVNAVVHEAGPTEAARLVDTILQQAREMACKPDREGDGQT